MPTTTTTKAKATILDAIIRSCDPTEWVDTDTARYRFNEVTVTARFIWDSPVRPTVEIIEWTDNS